jgi:hypothetical protein
MVWSVLPHELMQVSATYPRRQYSEWAVSATKAAARMIVPDA